jgi:hypothetical protein
VARVSRVAIATGTSGTRRGRLIDVERLVAEEYAVAGLELASANELAVDDRTVGGSQVLDDPGAVAEDEPGVLTRHAVVAECDVATEAPPKNEITFANCPVEREYQWRNTGAIQRSDHPPAGRYDGRCERRPSPTSPVSPGREIADHAVWVDETLPEYDVQAMRERLLAHKAADKRGTENSGQPIPRGARTEHQASVSHRPHDVQSENSGGRTPRCLRQRRASRWVLAVGLAPHTSCVLDVPNAVRRTAESYGCVGEAWLAGLPSIVGQLCEAWPFSVGEVLGGGTSAYVARVRARTVQSTAPLWHSPLCV